MTIKALAQAVSNNYAAGMSGGDDIQFQALIDLGDQADGIVKLAGDFETIIEALSLATTALCDIHKGYPHREIGAQHGTGLSTLLRELVTVLRGRGVYDEGAWDMETTDDIRVKFDLAPAPLLAAGTVITSIKGDSSTVDDEREISTGPMAEGYIERVLADQAECYNVVFNSSGVSVLLTQKELANQAAYKIGRKLHEGEIIGFDRGSVLEGQPVLLYWNEVDAHSYVDGVSLEDYGVSNLHEHELARVGVKTFDWALAKSHPDAMSTEERLTSELRDRGVSVSVWSVDDLDFLDEDDDVADLPPEKVESLKKAVLESASEKLESAVASRGSEILSDHWIENQAELLATVVALT